MRWFNQSGFTFNELLVAMGVATVAVMSYSLSSVHILRQQVVLDHSTTAIYLARDKMEELQARRPLPESDNCPNAGESGLSGKTGVKGVFSRCWRVAQSELNTNLKQIDVTVFWRDHDVHEVKLSTLSYTGNEESL